MPWCAVWHSLAANQLGVLGLALRKKITSNDKAPSVDSQVQADDKRPPEIFMQVRLTVYPEVKGRGFQWEVEIYENLLPGSSGSVSANSTSNSICWLVPLYRLKLRMVALLLYCEGRSSWILSTGGSRTSGRIFNQFQHHFVLQRSSSGSFMLSAGFVVCSRVEVSIKSQFWCLDHTSYTENYWVQQQVKTFRNMFDSPHSTLLLLFAPLLVQMKAPHYTENKWKWIPFTWCLILRQGLVQLESIKTSENTAHLAVCNLLPRQVSLLFMSLFLLSGWLGTTLKLKVILPDFIMYHLSFIFIYHLSHACCTVALRCAPGGWDRCHQHQRWYSRGTHQFVSSSRCQRPGICRNLRKCLCSCQLVVWSIKCWDSERNHVVCEFPTCFDSD